MTPEAGGISHSGRSANPHRICARRGCNVPVKKATAKYCSISCCSMDPERLERLRTRARMAYARPLPMTRQLNLGFTTQQADPEAQLAQLCEGREDVPAGMSRLAG